MKSEYFPLVLNVASGVAVFVLSVFVELRMPISMGLGLALGIVLVILGLAVVLWALFHLRSGITGGIEPKLDAFVRGGPYRFVRHPIYLGWAVALVGLAVALRSWAGLLGVFLLYLPSVIWRAKLEERALARRFGSAWEEYVERTGFLLPRF